MKALVTGATGFVGREVLRQLCGAGHEPRALVRHLEAGKRRLADIPAVRDFHQGDATVAESLKGAAEGCDAVIHLVGIISETRRITFQRLHVEATRNMVAATRAAGVRRYVHMSALGTRPGAASRYHQTKWAAEEIVRGSGLDFTIFRPSLIYGREDHFVNLFARMSKWSPMLPLIGGGGSLLQPVSVEAVARCFVRALDEPASVGNTYAICGPDRLTMRQILDAILAVTGRRRIIVRIPLPLARTQAALLEFVWGKILRRPPPLNRDQLIMLREDNAGDPEPANRLFGLKHPGFAEGIARYLAAKA